MSLVIPSSLSASLSGIELDYSTYSTSSTQLVRTGLYIEANTPNPVPHISMFPYATGTFGAAQLAQGDLFVEGANLKFFDGTNINTILSSGSGGSITVANISTGLQVQNGNIYGDTNATLSIDSTVVQNNIINTFTQPQIFNSSISASTLYLTDTAYNFAGNVPVYSRTSSNSANLAPGWYSIAITPNNSVQGRTAAWVTFTTRGGNQAPNSQLYYVQKDWANLGNITLLSALSNNSFTSQIRLVWISGSSPTPGATRLDIYIPSPETSSIAYVTVQPDTSQQIIMTATTFTALPELSVSESVIAIMSSSGMYAGMSVTGVTTELYKYTTSGYILNTAMLMNDLSNIGGATSQRPANIYVLNTVSASSLQAGRISGSFFNGDGTQITGIVTSSYATTASLALNANTASLALTGSEGFVVLGGGSNVSLDNNLIYLMRNPSNAAQIVMMGAKDNVNRKNAWGGLYSDGGTTLSTNAYQTGSGDYWEIGRPADSAALLYAQKLQPRTFGWYTASNATTPSGSFNAFWDQIMLLDSLGNLTTNGLVTADAFSGDGSSITGVISASYAVSSSWANHAMTGSQGFVVINDNSTQPASIWIQKAVTGGGFVPPQIVMGGALDHGTTLKNVFGSRYSGGDVVIAKNAWQTGSGDYWEPGIATSDSYLLRMVTNNGFQFYSASVGAQSGSLSTFWTNILNISPVGNLTTFGYQLAITPNSALNALLNVVGNGGDAYVALNATAGASGRVYNILSQGSTGNLLFYDSTAGSTRWYIAPTGDLFATSGNNLYVNASGSFVNSIAGTHADALFLLNAGTTSGSGNALYFGYSNPTTGYGARIRQGGFPSSTRRAILSIDIHNDSNTGTDSDWTSALFIDTGSNVLVPNNFIGTTVTASTGFSGDGSQITGVISSSYALSASYALNADNLDNQTGAFYTNASNINAGTIGNSFLPTAIGTVNTTYLGKLATLGNGGTSGAGLNLSGSSIVFNNSMQVGGWARGITWMEPSVLTYSPGAGTFFEVGVLGSVGSSTRGYIGYGNAPYNNYFFGFDSASLTTLVGRPINASTTFISASTFSGSYSGSAATLTNAFLTHISGTDATWTGDISIGSLGVFDHTSAPQNNYLLGFNGTTRKWTSRPVQLAVGSGIAGASSLGDGTVIVYTNSNPTLAGTGTPATPSAPVVTTKYLAFTVDMSGTPLSTTQTQTYVVQYAVNGGAYGALLTTNAPKFVHSNLISGSTYSYKYAVLNATATSSFSTPSAFMSASNTPVNDVFGIINADQISVAQLSAITGDIGTLTAGRIQNSSSTAGINFSGVVSSSWIRYIDFTATGSQVFWYMAPDTGSFIISVTSDGQASFQGNVFSPLVSASVVKSVTRIATPALYLNVSSSAILTASQIVATGNSLIAYGISAGSASVNQGGAGPLASATGSSIILGQYTRPSGTLTPETGTPGISSVSATTVVAGTIARTSINSTNTLLNTSPGMPAYDGNYTYNIEYSASAPQNASGYTNTLFIVAARTLYQSASHGFTSPWSVVATETLSLGDSLQGVAPYVANTPAGIIDSVQIETSGSIIVNASKILTGQATIETSYQTPISWNSGSVITHYRNGLYINKQEVSGTHYRLPHMTLEPLYDVPSGTAGMPGDICFVSGTHTGSAIVGMFMHDGSRWRQFAFI